MPSDDDVYWFGSYLHVLVMIAFLGNIWRTKSCSGISLKSQFLYALVFTTRHPDLDTPYLAIESIILKILYLIVTYGTVLSMVMFFRKTYEKRYDSTRIEIWVVACLQLSFFTNSRLGFLEMLTAFSIYLESVAMISQFQFIARTKRIDKNVIVYLAAMGAYAVLYFVYSIERYNRRPERYHFQVAASTIQLLLYCEFFCRIYPLMSSQDDDNQRATCRRGCFDRMYARLFPENPDDVEADVESEVLKTGHLSDNMSNIVLVHPALTGFQSEKESSGK